MGRVEGGSRFAGAKRFALRDRNKVCLTAKTDVDNVGAGRAAKSATLTTQKNKILFFKVYYYSKSKKDFENNYCKKM